MSHRKNKISPAEQMNPIWSGQPFRIIDDIFMDITFKESAIGLTYTDNVNRQEMGVIEKVAKVNEILVIEGDGRHIEIQALEDNSHYDTHIGGMRIKRGRWRVIANR